MAKQATRSNLSVELQGLEIWLTSDLRRALPTPSVEETCRYSNVSRQLGLMQPQLFIYTSHHLGSSLLACQKTSKFHIPEESVNGATFCTNRGMVHIDSEVVGMLMRRDMQVHTARSALLPTCAFPFACWNFTSKLHKTIFRMCYFRLEQCEQCCNGL